MEKHLDSRITKVGKNDIHYLTGGDGIPLVVVHGGGGGSTAWLQTAMELSGNYRVYVPDLPGFGKSKSGKERFNLSYYVEFLDDFSRSLELNDFYLVGHSVGGCIALLYALKFPNRTRKLVLISSMCLGREIALWVRVLSSSVVIYILHFQYIHGYTRPRPFHRHILLTSIIPMKMVLHSGPFANSRPENRCCM